MGTRVILKGQELITLENFNEVIGNIENLSTKDKTNIINAINELAGQQTIIKLNDNTVVLADLETGIYRLMPTMKKIKYGNSTMSIKTMEDDTILIVNKGVNGNTTGTLISGYNSSIAFFDTNNDYYKSINADWILTTTREQTITGLKKFDILPESEVIPTGEKQFVNKKYVDDLIGDVEIILATLTTIGVNQ